MDISKKAMAKAQAMAAQKQIEAEVQDIQKIQRGKHQTLRGLEMGKLYDARRKYHEKRAENEGVMKEFGYLDSHSTVYKMVGPVLCKQELAEAKQTVEKRLAYINKEM